MKLTLLATSCLLPHTLELRCFCRQTKKMVEVTPPRNFVQSVVVHNDIDEENRWVGMRLERGSWVVLSARRTGPWANRDTSAVGGASSMRGAWKGRIIDFRFKNGSGDRPGRATNKPVLDGILVRWAFTRSQICVEPASTRHIGPCNCKCTSQSLLHLEVIHIAFVGSIVTSTSAWCVCWLRGCRCVPFILGRVARSSYDRLRYSLSSPRDWRGNAWSPQPCRVARFGDFLLQSFVRSANTRAIVW